MFQVMDKRRGWQRTANRQPELLSIVTAGQSLMLLFPHPSRESVLVHR